MTRKLLTLLLRERLEAEHASRGFVPTDVYNALLCLALSFADEFSKHNPRFARARFLRECGFTGEFPR